MARREKERMVRVRSRRLFTRAMKRSSLFVALFMCICACKCDGEIRMGRRGGGKRRVNMHQMLKHTHTHIYTYIYIYIHITTHRPKSAWFWMRQGLAGHSAEAVSLFFLGGVV